MSDYRVLTAWHLQDPRIEQDAIAFWRTLNILPRGTDPAARARELCAVAYLGKELVGVATASLEILPLVRCRFAMYRSAIAPEHRGSGAAFQLITHSRELLEKWSAEHPEEGVMGMAAIFEGYKGDTARLPVWPLTGLVLATYSPQGHQVRVAWFQHARVD